MLLRHASHKTIVAGIIVQDIRPPSRWPLKTLPCVAYEYCVKQYSTSQVFSFADCCITVFSFFVSASPKNPRKKSLRQGYPFRLRVSHMHLARLREPGRGDHMHVPYLVVSDCRRIKSSPNDTSKLSTYVKEQYGLILN